MLGRGREIRRIYFEFPTFDIEFSEDGSTIKYVLLKETARLVLEEFDEVVANA